MFLKIGRQLTVMDNSVCNKGVYETSFFYFIYYHLLKKWEICTIMFWEKEKREYYNSLI